MNKGKMVPDQLRDCTRKIDRQQIREVFLRNGFTIKPGHDDLKDYVYEAAFELLELTAHAVQGEPEPISRTALNDVQGI